MHTKLSVDDDSGILGLVNCATYLSFVSEDWEYEQLIEHFRAQAKSKSILVWDAGDGGDLYRMEIRLTPSDEKGFREATGHIAVTDGLLHLASYTAITMAAQYDDERLPAKTEAQNSISLPNGDYRVRLVQKYDPNEVSSHPSDKPHFVLELSPGTIEGFNNVVWFSA